MTAPFVSVHCSLAASRGFPEAHARCADGAAINCTCKCHLAPAVSSPAALSSSPRVRRAGEDAGGAGSTTGRVTGEGVSAPSRSGGTTAAPAPLTDCKELTCHN